MSFTWSSWGLLIAVGLLIVIIMALAGFEDESASGKEVAQACIGLLIIFGVVWNGGTALISPNQTGPQKRHASDLEVAERYFGFTSGAAYPLELGSQAASPTTYDSVVETGFFSATAHTQAQGGTAITVAFTHQDTTYTLSLPRHATPIKINNDKKPQVIVRLANMRAASGYYSGTWSDCKWVISNLAVACERTWHEDSSTLNTSPATKEAGLGKLVASTFESAEITMTSAMYDQLIGRIE